jgi:hypothetical protein
MNESRPVIVCDGPEVFYQGYKSGGGNLLGIHLVGAGGDYISKQFSAYMRVQPGTYTVYLLGYIKCQGGISAQIRYQEYEWIALYFFEKMGTFPA